jgi:hypothetical protein
MKKQHIGGVKNIFYQIPNLFKKFKSELVDYSDTH